MLGDRLELHGHPFVLADVPIDHLAHGPIRTEDCLGAAGLSWSISRAIALGQWLAAATSVAVGTSEWSVSSSSAIPRASTSMSGNEAASAVIPNVTCPL